MVVGNYEGGIIGSRMCKIILDNKKNASTPYTWFLSDISYVYKSTNESQKWKNFYKIFQGLLNITWLLSDRNLKFSNSSVSSSDWVGLVLVEKYIGKENGDLTD